MPIPEEALDLENRSIGINGEPTLAAAYEILKNQWNNGERDRELGLHLMFLAWYGTSEPEYITGFSDSWKKEGKRCYHCSLKFTTILNLKFIKMLKCCMWWG